MDWVEVICDVAFDGCVAILAIPFEEGRERFLAGVIDGELDGIIDFVARADAFEWLGGVWIDEAVKDFAECRVVVQIVAENLVEALVIDEWIKHDVDVETLRTVAAPAIGLRADVAATENFEVAWEFDEFLHDFVFVDAAQKAKIVEFIRDIICDVGAEIVFEIDAL